MTTNQMVRYIEDNDLNVEFFGSLGKRACYIFMEGGIIAGNSSTLYYPTITEAFEATFNEYLEKMK